MSARDELMDALREQRGTLPANISQVLMLLTQPNTIAQTRAFLDEVDLSYACTLYKAPWNCVYEMGEVRSKDGLVYDDIWEDLWCPNCVRRMRTIFPDGPSMRIKEK